MPSRSVHRARLLVEIPPERYTTLTPVRRAPRVGDMLDIDHCFTGSDGLAMVLAYFSGSGRDDLYEVKVYESELSPVGRDKLQSAVGASEATPNTSFERTRDG
jgi:hypothetical protein